MAPGAEDLARALDSAPRERVLLTFTFLRTLQSGNISPLSEPRR